MAETFTAQVKRAIAQNKAKQEAVFKQSAQDVLRDAQRPVAKGGRMPVDTGFLRNSLQSGLNGATNAEGADSYVMVIAGAEITDTIDAVWTAEYARAVEYGARGRPGRFFARGAAQKWPQIVAENARKLK